MPLDAPVTSTIMEATASLRSPVLDRQFRRRMPFQPIGQRRVHACLPARAGGAEGSQNIGIASEGNGNPGFVRDRGSAAFALERVEMRAHLGAGVWRIFILGGLLAPRNRRAHPARISSSVIVVSFEPLIVYLSFFPARWPETDDSRCIAFGKNNR